MRPGCSLEAFHHVGDDAVAGVAARPPRSHGRERMSDSQTAVRVLDGGRRLRVGGVVLTAEELVDLVDEEDVRRRRAVRATWRRATHELRGTVH